MKLFEIIIWIKKYTYIKQNVRINSIICDSSCNSGSWYLFEWVYSILFWNFLY